MSNGNANYFPWDDINEKDELPTGIYQVRVTYAEDGNAQSSGKRMPKVGYQVAAPADYVNMSHFENYTLGTDENPTGINKGTMGAKALKKLCLAAQVPPQNDITKLMQALMGSELLIAVRYSPDADFKNNITNYYRIGEREVGVAQTKSAGAARPVPTAPVAPPIQQPGQPGGQGQQTPATPPMPPQQPAAPATPATPQAPPAPPSQPQAPAAAPPPQPPVGDAGQMIRCGLCNRDVPVETFGAHVQRHQSEPNWDGVSA